MESGIHGRGIRNPRTWNPESTMWNPESKALLDYLTWADRTYQRKYKHASLRDLEDFPRSANQLTTAVIVGRELLHGVDMKTSMFSALECIHHAVFKRRAVESKDATFGNQGVVHELELHGEFP